MTAIKNGTSPDKRRKYNDTFNAEALCLASESRSTQAAAQQLGYQPHNALPLAAGAARGSHELEPVPTRAMLTT